MEDNKLKEFMQHSKLEIQFPDFEENVMEQIIQKEKAQKSVWRNLKISWLFFIIGAFLGILVSKYITYLEFPFFNENSKLVTLVVEILIVLVIVSQFDKLLYFTLKKKD